MPVTMPQVTGWPTYQPGDLANIYDPFASIKIAQAVEDLQRGNVLRKIESIKLQDLQRESGISEQMLGAGRELLNQTPGGNVLAPSAPSAPSAQPQQQPSGSSFSPSGFGPMGFQAQPGIRSLASPAGNVTGSPFVQPSIGQVPQYGQPSGAVAPWPPRPQSQAPQASSPGAQQPQAPEMVRLSNGQEVSRQLINRYPQYFAQLEMKAREAQATAQADAQNKAIDVYQKGMEQAILTGNSRTYSAMNRFFQAASPDPRIRTLAKMEEDNFKFNGLDDQEVKGYFTRNMIDKYTTIYPDLKDTLSAPGFYKVVVNKGKVTGDVYSPPQNELELYATTPAHSAYYAANRILEKQMGMKEEGKALADDRRFDDIITKSNLGIPIPKEDNAWAKAYEKRKSLSAAAYGAARLQIMHETPIQVYDTTTGNSGFVTKGAIDKDPMRYVGPEMALKIKSKAAIFTELENSSAIMRKALEGLKGNYTTAQTAKFAEILKIDDNGGAIRNFVDSKVGKSLTKDEIDYVTAVANLRESAYGLRTIAGLGQGSDEMRRAIANMIPGPQTPSKDFAYRQLDLFDTEVSALKEAVPGLGRTGKVAPTTKVPRGLAEEKPGSKLKTPTKKGIVIDRTTAKEYLKAAGNDPKKARKMAEEAGWTVK